jgi:hypothetical protein
VFGELSTLWKFYDTPLHRKFAEQYICFGKSANMLAWRRWRETFGFAARSEDDFN